MFICVPYFADEAGEYRPNLPQKCGLSSASDCIIGVKERRSRTFGPTFKLTVIRCRSHQICCTLYPPGYTPYGRRPLVRLSPEGRPYKPDEESNSFEGTVFQAVLDGASRVAWPKSAMNGSLVARFNTQLKHIERGCLLLGLARGSPPTFDDCLRHLGVAGMDLHVLRERVMAEKGYRNRSEAACELLSLLYEDQTTFIGTSTLGYLANLWPKPQVLFASRGGKTMGLAHRPWI